MNKLFEYYSRGQQNQALQDFWARNKSSAWFKEHPHLAATGLQEDAKDYLSVNLCSLPGSCKGMNLDRTIHLVVHGDDAECHRRRSFMVLTWGSVLVNATPWDSKILSYVGDNSQLGDEAYKVLDAWVAWSLLELMLGHYLDVDPWGQPFNRSLSTIKRG